MVLGGLLGLAGESLPGFDELVVGVFGRVGGDFGEVCLLKVGLGVKEGGFERDEAGLAPGDGGELVDEGSFGVVGGLVAAVEFSDVGGEGGFVFDVEDDVDDGGEAVFEGVGAGVGFSGFRYWTFGFGAVDAGLFGVGVFLWHWVGESFLVTTVQEEYYR